MIKIRPAVQSDINEIMALERETFGELGEDAMATQTLMKGRISLCNTENFTGFWVAEYKGVVVGDIIFQPTNLDPRDCTSWEMATDGGNLETTFDLEGENIYIVSLAVGESSPTGVADLLAHTCMASWASLSKKHVLFCSRIPGFKNMRDKTDMCVEEYWQQKRRDGSPYDWMLREYSNMTGEQPFRLLKDGFPPDVDSGGHGVLFALTEPQKTLRHLAVRIHRAGIASGKKERRR